MSELVIGLTGPSGAGKSTVAAAFEKLGCKIIDADLIAHEVVTQPGCIAELKAAYGSDIADETGINRRLLAQRAFLSPESAQRLNEITHPKIMDEVVRQIACCHNGTQKAIVLDAPLLYESGADRLCTAVIAVTAPLQVRLNRIMQRDSIPPALAMARVGVQHEDAYYSERAKYVFNGAIGMNCIPLEVELLLKRILGEHHEDT